MLALSRWLLAEMRSDLPPAAERPESELSTVDKLDLPPPRRSSAAVRQQRARQRQRDGVRCYRLEIRDADMEATIDALVAYGRISEDDTMRRSKPRSPRPSSRSDNAGAVFRNA
jgi:hypothetical protein